MRKLTAKDLVGLSDMVRVYSQTGEDRILAHLFRCIGTTMGENGYLVDIGAGDGFKLSNTRLLLEHGWVGSLFDTDEHVGVTKAAISDENVNDVLAQAGVPHEFDLLSLDIDGQEFWVWRALRFRPRVVVVEVNGNLPAEPAVTIGRYPPWRWDGTTYYGASFSALSRLGHAKGYTLVHNQANLNLFFVRTDLIEPGFTIAVPFTQSIGHPPDEKNREWHHVTDKDLEIDPLAGLTFVKVHQRMWNSDLGTWVEVEQTKKEEP